MTMAVTEKRTAIPPGLVIALRIILAGMFLLSAVSKLYPSPFFALTTFEMRQLVPMGFDETVAAYFSRILIGCELALGILLLQNHYYKRLVLPGAFLLLLVFTAHLSYEVITKGNVGNCGCFGTLLPMTPVEAIIKNVIAMGIIVFLYRITDINNDRLNFFMGLSVLLASILLIFMVGPMQNNTTQPEEVMVDVVDTLEEATVIDTVDTAIPASTIDTSAVKKGAEETVVEEPKKKASGYANFFPDIDDGRKILAFFAPTCEHCKETARELTQMKKQVRDFPELRIVFMDEEASAIPDFFTFAGAKYPYKIADIATFWRSLGTTRDTPGLFYLWNGNVIKEYDGINEKAWNMADFKKVVVKKYGELK